MPRLKVYILIKCCIALAIGILGGTLLWNGSTPQEVRHTVSFVVSLDSGMDTADIITSNGDTITRLQASIQCIQDIVATHPKYAFGLITQGKVLRYLLPSTQDTGTFIHYVESLLTDGSSGSGHSRSSGMQTAEENTLMIQLGGIQNSALPTLQYIPANKLTTCKEQDIDSIATTLHLSPGEQQGLEGGIIILVLLLLL